MARQSVELYFGNITESVKELAREIKYRSKGKRSLSGELRSASLFKLMEEYGIAHPPEQEKNKTK